MPSALHSCIDNMESSSDVYFTLSILKRYDHVHSGSDIHINVLLFPSLDSSSISSNRCKIACMWFETMQVVKAPLSTDLVLLAVRACCWSGPTLLIGKN
jgi:hypothetical protein